MKGMTVRFVMAAALGLVMAAGAASAATSGLKADQSLVKMQLNDLAKLHRSNIQPQRRPYYCS